MYNTINQAGLNIIKGHEGFQAKPYICPAGVASIGYGTTRYPYGDLVTMRDKPITEKIAENYLYHDVGQFERVVRSLCIQSLNENQFSAIVSLVYNIGPYNFKNSSLLRKINRNPNDLSIREEFLKWVWGDGTHDGLDNDGDGQIDEAGEKRKLPGLVRRRTAEANLYFTQP